MQAMNPPLCTELSPFSRAAMQAFPQPSRVFRHRLSRRPPMCRPELHSPPSKPTDLTEGAKTMEFKVYQKELELQSRGWIPTFHDVTREICAIARASGVRNGTVCIASHHTTCSVMVQECSHDIDSFDLNTSSTICSTSCKLIPDFMEEHQYRHPGRFTPNSGGMSANRATIAEHERLTTCCARSSLAQRDDDHQDGESGLREFAHCPASYRLGNHNARAGAAERGDQVMGTAEEKSANSGEQRRPSTRAESTI